MLYAIYSKGIRAIKGVVLFRSSDVTFFLLGFSSKKLSGFRILTFIADSDCLMIHYRIYESVLKFVH